MAKRSNTKKSSAKKAKATPKTDASLKLNKKAEKARAQAATIKAIASNAKRANAALEKAEVAAGRADDLRLTAAIELGQAKTACAETGVNFKKWCVENVTQSYDTVRKLASIGQADDPALALADLRNRTKSQVKASRAKKATAPAPDVARLIASMPEEESLSVIGKHAKKHGMMVVPASGVGQDKDIKTLFSAMKKSEKLKFLSWAAAEVDAEVMIGGVEL